MSYRFKSDSTWGRQWSQSSLAALPVEKEEVVAVLKRHFLTADTRNLSPLRTREQGSYLEKDNSVGNSLLKRVSCQLLDFSEIH